MNQISVNVHLITKLNRNMQNNPINYMLYVYFSLTTFSTLLDTIQK